MCKLFLPILVALFSSNAFCASVWTVKIISKKMNEAKTEKDLTIGDEEVALDIGAFPWKCKANKTDFKNHGGISSYSRDIYCTKGSQTVSAMGYCQVGNAKNSPQQAISLTYDLFIGESNNGKYETRTFLFSCTIN